MGKEVSASPLPWNRTSEEGKDFHKLTQKAGVQLEAPNSFSDSSFSQYS